MENIETSDMFKYRNRAQERRDRYGITDKDVQKIQKEHMYKKQKLEPVVEVPTVSTTTPLGDDNKGNKMLKLMGWKEGEGLGKSSTGIVAPVDVTLRDTRAGLGMAVPEDCAILPGDTYKEITKKKARSRYEQLKEKEQEDTDKPNSKKQRSS